MKDINLKACHSRSFLSVLLAGIVVASAFASFRLIQTKELTLWIGCLALAAVSYLLLELNESKLRRLRFDKFEVDTRTW